MMDERRDVKAEGRVSVSQEIEYGTNLASWPCRELIEAHFDSGHGANIVDVRHEQKLDHGQEFGAMGLLSETR